MEYQLIVKKSTQNIGNGKKGKTKSTPYFCGQMEQEAKEIAERLKKGELVLLPTDTVWGISCDATHCEAVTRLMEIKNREEGKGFVVLVDNDNKLEGYAGQIPMVVWDLIEFADKPLTLILDGGKNVCTDILHPDGSIAIRVTQDPFLRAIIRNLKKPIVSTSANLAGKPAPSTWSEISKDLIEKVDFTSMHRKEEKRKSSPSTLLKITASGEIRIIRK